MEEDLGDGIGRGGGDIPLDTYGKFPRARHRLDDDIVLLDATAQQFRLGTLQEGVDDLSVPSRMYDANTQAGAIMLLGGGAFHLYFFFLISFSVQVWWGIFEELRWQVLCVCSGDGSAC